MAGERRQTVVVIAGVTIWYALLYGFDQFARANLEIEDCNFSHMGSCLPDSWYVFTMAGAVLAPIAVISLIFAWKKGVLTIAIGTAVAVAVLNTALFYGSGESTCPIRDPAASSAAKNLAEAISGIGFLAVMFAVPLFGGWLTALKEENAPRCDRSLAHERRGVFLPFRPPGRTLFQLCRPGNQGPIDVSSQSDHLRLFAGCLFVGVLGL